MSVSSEELALTDSETLEEVIKCLGENLAIETQGVCDQQTLFEILIKAASSGDSIENTAKLLKNIPTANDIRYHLNKINNFEELERQINQILKSRIPAGLKKRCLKIAIDLNLIGYYGKPSTEELPYIYRSEAKSGTNSFYAYATLYVINNNKRVTLAIRGVRRFDTSVAIITYLLAELDSLQINVKKLYLDRGFFNTPVIRWLQALDIPFMMPAIKTGKQGGIKQFLQGKKSYKTTYTITREQDDSVTFELWIVCKYRKGKRNQRGVQYFAYVAYKNKTNLNYIYQDYRKRFGIETSYRLKNICRIKTNNKNPVLRLLFVGISFLLVNIWVNLLWLRISRKRKGSRLIYRTLFTFKQMLAFLSQVIERKYIVVESIYIPTG
ncbi:ISH3 family transposase [Nodularia spumigena CS-591/04]|uniref:ISH3 family transposase n=1 Tax=Nodularia spumigena TaxID=70799 RepID=UPI00232F82A9|nr:ISH3 family transposase [Nodularia spumigena]MDB9318558.1 ISH3 family transposase [Nodularia spumigena CS-590/01A]MDB9328613.1 ISH3 family transposase [Nodularia spumigena CS-590/02]MDB9332653.1 ISH3 family transposase [Nodularia spumigena CS-591/04]